MNPNAWGLFLRDMEHLVAGFQRHGLHYEDGPLARSLWEPLYGPVQRESLLVQA